jgi:hypothetical protein
MEDEWIDCNTYILNTVSQGTDRWKQYREGRVTMSKIGACVGHSAFSSPNDQADYIAGMREEIFSENSTRIMKLGNEREPLARDWYCSQYKCIVREVGLAVPKWNPYLGASLDGEIIDENGVPTGGMIEIKCPEKMYLPIVNYMAQQQKGNTPIQTKTQIDYLHIWKTHYDQMQGCMAICNKQWCDYVVYCIEENKIFTQRVYFDSSYWSKELYPSICSFIDYKLKPRLVLKNKFPYMPPGI